MLIYTLVNPLWKWVNLSRVDLYFDLEKLNVILARTVKENVRTRSLINGIDYRSIVVQSFVELSQRIHGKSKKNMGTMGSEPESKLEHIRVIF